MKLEIEQLILNEKQVVEEMLETSIVPQFYNSYIVANRLYRYFNGDIDKVVEQLINLGIVYVGNGATEKQINERLQQTKTYVKEMFENYTEIQPLSQDKSIKIYKSELQTITKLKSRQTQRTAFGLLMFKKIINEKYGLKDNMLRLDSIDEIFNYVKGVDRTEKTRNTCWYEIQQNGIIDVDFDCNIKLKILAFDGESVETIKDKFDDCDYWFDKLVPENTNLETIVAVLPDGTFKIYKNEGFRGTATRFEEDYKIKADGANIRKCCLLQKKHYKKNIFFILDEERYELEKEQYIETMIKERQDLLKKKK